ncbi:MAG: hypothetical protein JST59_02210 [Actinobacteria bacterium]|nr:hypothetical protein [Actinomycetota bacterium]
MKKWKKEHGTEEVIMQIRSNIIQYRNKKNPKKKKKKQKKKKKKKMKLKKLKNQRKRKRNKLPESLLYQVFQKNKRLFLKPSVKVTSSSSLITTIEKVLDDDTEYTESVGPDTTHVVVGATALRSEKVLMALAFGIPIVSFDWISESETKEEWLDSADFENTKFSSKKSREAAKNKKRLFHGLVFHIYKEEKMKRSTLEGFFFL